LLSRYTGLGLGEAIGGAIGEDIGEAIDEDIGEAIDEAIGGLGIGEAIGGLGIGTGVGVGTATGAAIGAGLGFPKTIRLAFSIGSDSSSGSCSRSERFFLDVERPRPRRGFIASVAADPVIVKLLMELSIFTWHFF